MRQNPYNAVIGLGHHNGVVTFWSPNMTTPLAKVFAHKAPVLALAFDQTGTHMVTSGLDGKVKVMRVFFELICTVFSLCLFGHERLLLLVYCSIRQERFS